MNGRRLSGAVGTRTGPLARARPVPQPVKDAGRGSAEVEERAVVATVRGPHAERAALAAPVPARLPDVGVRVAHGVVGQAAAAGGHGRLDRVDGAALDRKSTRLNSSHANISYAVFCLKKN